MAILFSSLRKEEGRKKPTEKKITIGTEERSAWVPSELLLKVKCPFARQVMLFTFPFPSFSPLSWGCIEVHLGGGLRWRCGPTPTSSTSPMLPR